MRAWPIGCLLLLVACATLRDFDPAKPAEAWDVSCFERDIPGMPSWVILDCALQNHSREALVFPLIDKVVADNAAWRQPEPEEIKQLEHDLKVRGKPLGLVTFVGGGHYSNAEGMIAHLVVLSGVLVLAQTANTIEMPKDGVKAVTVQSRESVNQSFVLYRESLEDPDAIILKNASGDFSKLVDLSSNHSRRRGRP